VSNQSSKGEWQVPLFIPPLFNHSRKKEKKRELKRRKGWLNKEKMKMLAEKWKRYTFE